MGNSANATPTKRFFIDMLTRDIEIYDAILDLLDNCIDGAVRSVGENAITSYEGFSANVSISDASFILEDNCGGIPRDIAEKYAFRMGRAYDDPDDSRTIGIYGIGMKRAIFKLGRSAYVETSHGGKAYRVVIPEKWADDPDDWNLPIEHMPSGGGHFVDKEDGTRIVVECINASVARQWSGGEIDVFVDELIGRIRESFSLILEKGFKVSVNGVEVSPLPVEFLITSGGGERSIQPYIVSKQYDEVKMSLIVGFYAAPPSDDDLDEEAESIRKTSLAGVTVVCNDRVVLYNDKSHLTGWGVAGVPKYHTQFSGIRGLVVFESEKPELLPMTTTKRGVDLSSEIYANAKDYIRDGLRLFTGYTNKWKGRIDEERSFSSKATRVSFDKAFEKTVTGELGIKPKTHGQAEEYRPSLPEPPNKTAYAVIRYSKSKAEISLVEGYLYSDDSSIERRPSQIGEACFDFVHSRAMESD